MHCRYPHNYPAHSVSLKLKNPQGLPGTVVRDLLNQLQEAAQEHAEAEEVRSSPPWLSFASPYVL